MTDICLICRKHRDIARREIFQAPSSPSSKLLPSPLAYIMQRLLMIRCCYFAGSQELQYRARSAPPRNLIGGMAQTDANFKVMPTTPASQCAHLISPSFYAL